MLRRSLALSLAACALGATACSESGTVEPVSGAEVVVSFNQSATTISEDTGKVTLADVSSIQVSIARIQVKSGEATDPAAAWIDVAMDPPGALDLMTLPVDGAGQTEVGRVLLPAGTYPRARLILDVTSNITFAQTVSLKTGNQTTAYAADTPYGIQIQRHVGVLVDMDNFTVGTAGGAVVFTVDVAASIDAIQLTIPGGLKMEAVVSGRGM